jgi:hypothetical protein
MQRDDPVKSALIDAVLEFLSAAVHTVLKARNVYSAELFENRRLYGISVSQCRHPDVCLYVGTVLGNLKVGGSAACTHLFPCSHHCAFSMHTWVLVFVYGF